MRQNRTLEEVRNGHFKLDGAAANTDHVLVNARATGYRVFNSGANAIDVTANGQTRVLTEGCSIDVQHPSGPITLGNTTPDEEIEGGYLSFDPNTTPRVGRVVRRASLTNNDVHFVERAAGSGPFFYRIVNSGAALLIGNPAFGAMSSNQIRVPSKCSLDIATAGQLKLKTVVDNRPLRCIYTQLRTVDTGKVFSGRFSRQDNTDINQALVIIMNTTARVQWYRIGNSGSQPFSVGAGTFSGQPGSAPFVNNLAKGQSADFSVAVGARIAVWVSAADVTIRGIYDYLGDA
jgi:hypothetical protein